MNKKNKMQFTKPVPIVEAKEKHLLQFKPTP